MVSFGEKTDTSILHHLRGQKSRALTRQPV